MKPEQSIQSYVIDFIKKWKNIALPVIKNNLDKKNSWIDMTEDFKVKKGCRITYNGILLGKKVYGLAFPNCRHMAEKWKLTPEGDIKKDSNRKPIVKVYSTSVALVPLDLVVDFISTDEILPINKNFAGPYALGQKWIETLMEKYGFSSEKDLIFFFVVYQDEISHKIRRFLKEFEYVLEGGYLRKKGFLRMDGPQWRDYYPSRELTETSKLFLNSTIESTFDVRRLGKIKNIVSK